MQLRKWMSGFLALVLVMLALVPVVQAQSSKEIRIYLDGRRIETDAAPYIKPKVNFTMVPVRVISQGIGASVDWSPGAKTVTIRKAGVHLVLTTGKTTANVNGNAVTLDAPPEIVQGRTMVPLRFVSEQLGLQVNWDAKNRWIQLISKPGQELKGAWVSTVYNLDWPSVGSYGRPEQQKQEFVQLLDELQAIGLNAVFVQVRPAGDALYPSKLVPWSKYLTGVQGKDPGYDPLAFMIEETHRRGMAFHAWFNPFRATVDGKLDALAANHAAVKHPEWIVEAGGKHYFNPGIPAVRQHIIDAIMEVVNQYSIDGVHLDDYFYPSGVAFHDDAAFQAYGGDKFANIGDWRRANINEFVQRLGETVHAAKPDAAYGISPFGVWRNQKNDARGSATNAGVSAYDDMYADVRTWVRNEWVDYIMPQVYWSLSFPAARYDILVDWWAAQVEGTNVKLYVGHAPYKLGTGEAGWNTAEEIVNQLKYNAAKPQVRGDVFFSAKDLRRNPLGIQAALRNYYQP